MATGQRGKGRPGRKPKEIVGEGPVENLARELRALIEQQDPPVTHGRLARLSGCATGTVSKALAGNALPTANVLTALVGALGEHPSGWLARRAEAAELLRRRARDPAPAAAPPHPAGDPSHQGTGPQDAGCDVTEPATATPWRPSAGRLVGRTDETRRIQELLAGAAAHRSGVLVVRGEPGIGKTALLEKARGLWSTRHLAFRCVESEAELAFAALGGLLRPLTPLVQRLPAPRARALAVSLALAHPDPGEPPPGRIAIGLGTLDLLTKAAPVLVLLDDVQWMDAASAAALSYAARQLPQEGIAVVIGVRTGTDCPMDLTGHPAVDLAPLGSESVRELAGLVRGRAVDADWAERLVRHTGGNPLAILELSRSGLPPDGASRTEAPLRLPQVLEAAFRQRLEPLSAPQRWALLVCAASYTADLAEITAALGPGGPAQLEGAESAGLIALTPHSVEFAHPVLRSVVYHQASAARRRAAHALLARALLERNSPSDAGQRAWHLADAALGTDEQVAQALADHAAQAQRRGGLADAHAAYLRAAGLTPDPAARGLRLLAAATCAQLAGRPDAALPLLSEARGLVVHPQAVGEIEQVHQQIRQIRATPHDVFVESREKAAALRATAPMEAANLLATAAGAGAMGGLVAQALAAAADGHRLARGAGEEAGTPATAVLRAHTLLLDGRTEPAAALLRGQLDRLLAVDPLVHGTEVFGFASMDLMWLDEHTAARRVIEHGLRHIRDAHALERVTVLTSVLADLEFRTGRWQEARAAAAECMAVADQLGQRAILGYSACTLAQLEAARGERRKCEDYAARALACLEPGGYGLVAPYARLALAQASLADGEYTEAATRFVALHERVDGLGVRNPAVYPLYADMVEAGLRAHRPDAFGAALVALSRCTGPSVPGAVRGALARCRGLLAKDADHALRHFSAALGLYERAADRYGLARTGLAMGQRLRRTPYRDQARRQLRAALALFRELAAAPWARRGEEELSTFDG